MSPNVFTCPAALLAGAVLLGPAAGQRPGDSYGVKIPQAGSLASVDDRAVFLQVREVGNREVGDVAPWPFEEVSLSWRIARDAQGCTLRVADGERHRGWYLSYDPDAPERGAFLTEAATAGSYWRIGPIPASPPRNLTTIRARAGGRDWYLDVDTDSEKKYLSNQVIRAVQTVCRLRLTEVEGPKFEIYEHAR